MSFPTTLGLHELYRRLGAIGPAVPPMGQGPIVPVAVVGDFHDTLTGEPFEARGISGGTQVAVAGNRGFFSLFAAQRACVVESIRVKLGNANASLSINITSPPFINPFVLTATSTANLGGVPTAAMAGHGFTPAFVGGAALPMDNVATDLPTTAFRAYVPGGAQLLVQCSLVNTQIECSMIWREIAAPSAS